jgi:pimeloyl-ACP methyl ester carboxylesterase
MRSMKSLFAAIALTATTATMLAPELARASDAHDAADFHELLRSGVSSEMSSDEKLALVHMLPDQDVLAATEASSVEMAIALLKRSSLSKLVKETQSTSPSNGLIADDLLARHPLTIVLVPGIFGEFIPTRAFEEVLAQASVDRDAFKAKVADAIRNNDPNGQDLSYDFHQLKEKPLALNELVNVGTLKDKSGRAIAKVVLMFTPFMSLESMGTLTEHASMFNRRLSKYLALTGPQELAIVGYSRGTDLSLEMLAQAKAQNASWLPSVKAMISLGGVTWGSSLADDTENTSSANYQAIQEVKKLRNSIDPNDVHKTINAWATFGRAMIPIAPKMTSHPKMPESSSLKASPLNSGVDAKSIVGLTKLLWAQFDLAHPIADFAPNVLRFQALIDAALDGVGQLTTRARTEWWASHAIPLSVKYYSITGAMANPEASDVDNLAFNTAIGYNKTYDDLSLLQNRLDYESLSGIALNDSQVSVAQAMILPNAAERLNPLNAGMKSAFLGTVGTHHWGLALRTVNAMKDGRTNPFPREALLKALAAKVALDLEDAR